ncbi:MAG: HNH endonuclease [Blastocatellia bacterium]
MATFLLTWNPRHYEWETLDDEVSEVAATGESIGRWSTGVSRRPVQDDRFFLIRLGVDPKGIMASGTIESEVFEDAHWHGDMEKSALYAEIRFDILLNPDAEPILPREALNQPDLRKMHWDAQSSGTTIPDDVASILESEWYNFLHSHSRPPIMENLTVLEGTRTETKVYRRGRSRTLRDTALARSSGVCEVCDVNFSKLLGGLGVRVLQVHHRRQLSAYDEPSLTELTDLAVVCANCHALIHSNPKVALKVDELRELLFKSAV